MSDPPRPDPGVRAWGWVAIVFGLVPGTFLLVDIAEGSTGPSRMLDLGIPFVVLTTIGMLLVGVGGHLARVRGRGDEPIRLAKSFRRPGRLVFSLTALLVLFSGLFTPMCACGPRERAYEAAVRSDLRNLMSEQEIYYSEHDRYAASQDDLEYYAWSEGVSIVMRAGPQGFTARGTHVGFPDPDGSCVIYVGLEEEIEPFRTLTGLEPPEKGLPFCDPDY